MNDTLQTKTGRTPWHLWLIGVLAVLWNAVGALDYVMTETRNATYLEKFPPEQIAFFFAIPPWVVAAWAIAVWGGVLGAILLLLRRRLAIWVFLASLVGLVVTTFHNYVLANGLEVFPDAASQVFTVVIGVIAVALFLYARAMGRRGVLV